ncbi:hypothetical protein BJY00DRAFT_318507 [Aspergillus carlsbadensis]|nr:hypothetical protein BJY00DRAFT_318507 [Aspergillus carlsbadensis]
MAAAVDSEGGPNIHDPTTTNESHSVQQRGRDTLSQRDQPRHFGFKFCIVGSTIGGIARRVLGIFKVLQDRGGRDIRLGGVIRAWHNNTEPLAGRPEPTFGPEQKPKPEAAHMRRVSSTGRWSPPFKSCIVFHPDGPPVGISFRSVRRASSGRSRRGVCVFNFLLHRGTESWLETNQDRVLGDGNNASISMHRIFDVDDEMAAHETLYFSDQKVYPHYRKDNWRNNGHRQAGGMETNLDSFRENDSIRPKVNKKGKVYYKADYCSELQVNGRNMNALIRYPPEQKVQGENQICIAVAFKPGTKRALNQPCGLFLLSCWACTVSQI